MRTSTGPWGCLGLIVVVLVLGIGGFGWAHSTEHSVTITVNRLDDQPTSHNGHQYLVFTDQGVYKDTDSVFFLKFNSSDLYDQLAVGKTYRCTSTGARIPVLSSYRNLLSCTPAHP